MAGATSTGTPVSRWSSVARSVLAAMLRGCARTRRPVPGSGWTPKWPSIQTESGSVMNPW